MAGETFQQKTSYVNDGLQSTFEDMPQNITIETKNLGNVLGDIEPSIAMTGKSTSHQLMEEIRNTQAGATIYVKSNDDDAFIYITNKFYLQSMAMSFREKAQLIETLGSPSVTFFGDTVKIYNFAGTALDWATNKFDKEHITFHQSSLLKLYNESLRGSQLIKENNIAQMRIMNHLITGYPINFNANWTSQMDKLGTFAMSWVVTNHQLLLPGIISDESKLKDLYTKTDIINPDVKQAMDDIDDLNKVLRNLIFMSRWLDSDSPSAQFFKQYETILVLDTAGFLEIWDQDVVKTDFFTELGKRVNDAETSILDKYKVNDIMNGAFHSIMDTNIVETGKKEIPFFNKLRSDIIDLEINGKKDQSSLLSMKGKIRSLEIIRQQVLNARTILERK